ncbi:hypothetical protein V0288_04090 [Pannus brasiliensis CCIBt3594]|uniref:Tetratricopeptide repeat protein n=1 Tax=Pannus brasiliensis CCIBt3594 TaxID=1427578 RepID=A0AAW9QEV2_9CHRO
MIKEVAEAIDRQDYQTADRLIRELQNVETDNPWLKFYAARLNEVSGELAIAAREYRELLRLTTNPKLIASIRQGIGRIELIEQTEIREQKQQRQSALEQAKAAPENQELGVLILEPIPSEQKQAAAKEFGRIMGLDPYTARLQLPSRAWRLYRVGPLGELQVYVNDFRAAGIPCFCAPVAAIGRPEVYLALHFENADERASIVYEPVPGSEALFSFDWSDASAIVEGLLPIFGECVDVDARRKQIRKIGVLDYARVIDLHLPSRNAIVRICDRHYNFQRGHAFAGRPAAGEAQTTNRDNWNQLDRYLKQKLPGIPVRSDFQPFAETTVDFYPLLKAIDPRLDLLRIEETYWDTAFQLYSGLIFLEKSPPPALP